MKPEEKAEAVTQPEIVETEARESAGPSGKAGIRRRRDAPLRYALMLVAALLVAWVAFNVYGFTQEVCATMDEIDGGLARH